MNPLLVLATWILVLPLAAVAGTPFARLAGVTGPQFVRVSLWSGLAVLTVAVTALNQWLPLRGVEAVAVVLLLTLASGVAGLGHRPGGIRQLGVGWHRVRWTLWLFAAVTVGVLALGSSLSPTHYDFGLYHFQMVQLAAEFPAIPGQANLLSYLGYANTEFPWAAFLTNGPAGVDGYRTLNGLLILLLLGDLLLRALSGSRGPGMAVSSINVVVALVPLLVFADLLVASPTSDTAVFVLTLASTAALAQALGARRLSAAAIVSAIAPLLVATSMRPQAALVLLATCVVLVVVAIRGRLGRHVLRTAVGLAGLAGVFVLAVLARDYRLSGWGVYPLSMLPFDVTWRADDPASLRAITIGIARDPGPAYQDAAQGWAWLPGWLARQPLQWEFWLSLLLVALAVGVLVWARRRGGALRLPRLALLLAPSVAFLVIWVVALPPTWRLAWGPAFAAGSAVVGWGLHAGRANPERIARAALGAVAVVAILSAVVRYPAKPTAFPPAPAQTVVLPSGLTVTIPTETDQCWDNPVPCTPQPDPRLRQLGPRLADGLAVSPQS